MSMYYQDQTKRLGNASRYAVQVQNRDSEHPNHGATTHWLAVSADQFARIATILCEQDSTYEIQPTDVGQAFLRAFGKMWSVADFVGHILPGDVGKRVHKVDTSGDPILQVESNEQRDARLSR